MRQIIRTQKNDRLASDHRAARTRTQRQRRFHVEAFEDRRLMTYGVTLVGGDLVINTQSGNTNTVSVHIDAFGSQVNLNGQTFSYPGVADQNSEINQVTLNLQGSNDTANILGTSPFAPVTINDGTGTNSVYLSPTDHYMGNIEGDVIVNGGSGYDTLTIDNQGADPWGTNQTHYWMTGSTFNCTGSALISYNLMNVVTVNGNSNGQGIYEVQDTEAQFTTNLNTGSGGILGDNTVYVYGTSGTSNITSGGPDTVIVGNDHSLQGINGTLNIENPPYLTTLIVDDAADPTPQTATLDTFTPSGDTPWGSITGLAPAAINYEYTDTSSVSITTGLAADAVNVHATGATTNLSSANGLNWVYVGNAGSVQGVLGTLNIESPSGWSTLNVDDSADHSGRTVALDTFTPANDSPWGAITGLAPASINYEYNDTSSVSITTGSAADTVNVHATGATTNLSAHGPDTINVGNAGSVRGIFGTLNIENPPYVSTLTVDDSADHFGRTVTLNTFTPSGDSTWASITGLAPAAINYEQYDIGSPVTINGGLAGNTFNVVALPAQTVDLYTGGGNDKVNVETTSGSLVVNGQGGNNTLVGPNGNETWHITGTNAGSVGGVSFSNVQNLTGGTGNDLLVFSNGAGVTGTINGGGGTNELDYAAYTAAVTVNLASHTATGTGGFANIQTFVGGSGSNTLVGPNATNTWNITGTNGGSVAGVTFSAFPNLTGGTGMDVFKFSAGNGVTGKINGGGGGDWLDYALYTTPVTVNLTTGAATGVGGGVTNVPNVRGGAGTNTLTGNAQGNILIGGASTNIITGGSGRSILIGDTGAATVKGGTGDDIVIGGYTNYDTSSTANDLALEAILAEWRSADSYTTRVSKIKAGLPGGYKLVWGTTVHDNGKADTLTGGGGMNWFFKGTKDKITDFLSGEQIN
jgi:hypothetical protein